MIVYESAYDYISTSASIKEKIDKVDQVIAALMDTAIKSAANDNISEYHLNDGQTQIRTMYKGTDAVLKSIQDFERIKQMYENKLNNQKNGRMMRLVDSKNFRR